MSVIKILKPLVLAVSAVTAPSVVFAAGDSSGGLPQLDIATWPNQLFWLVVTFTILYLLMQFVVTPRISTVLEDRRAKVSGDLEKAKEDVATEAAQETVKQLIGVKATKAEVAKQVKAAAKAANA